MRYAWFGAFLALFLVAASFGATFTVGISPSSINSSSNSTLNFTITNTNDTQNITNITLVLPSGFSFVANTNGTTASNTNYTSLQWLNRTTSGIIPNGTARNFWITSSVGGITGSYNILVQARDTQGNAAEKNVTLTVSDATAPTITLNSPSNGASTGSQVDFQCSATDNVGLTNVSLWGNFPDGLWARKIVRNVSGTSATLDYGYGSIPLGNYTWTCQSYDSSSNSVFAQNFTFNVTAQQNFAVTLVSPGSHVNTNWALVNATTNQDSTGVVIEFNSTNRTMTNTTSRIWTYNLTNLTAGNYSFKIYANKSGSVNATLNSTFTVDTTNPTASISINETLIYAGQSVSITCTMSDSHPSNVSINITGPASFNGAANSSILLLRPNASMLVAGNYQAKCVAADRAGNTVSVNRSFAVFSQQNVNQWVSVVNLTSNTTKEINVTNALVDVTKVSLVSTSSGLANIEVSKLADRPATLPVAPAGNIFTYLQITLTSGATQSAVVEFKVAHSWILSNNIDRSSIKLYRYTTSWETLNTQFVREDSTYSYFTASTPGFSYFAIGGKVAAQPAQSNNTFPKDEDNIPAQKEGSSAWIYILIGIILMLGGIGYYLYVKGYLYMLEIPTRRHDNA